MACRVWAAPCNNDKVSFGNEGLREEGRDTSKRTGGQKGDERVVGYGLFCRSDGASI